MAHFDKGLALYNAAEHRPLATRFWVDSRIVIFCYRSLAAWVLGYPAAAISDSDQAVGDGRDIGQPSSLMYALLLASFTHTFCGNYATGTALVNEVTALADEKGSLVTKAIGKLVQAEIFALNDNATAALQSNIYGLNALRQSGTHNKPRTVSYGLPYRRRYSHFAVSRRHGREVDYEPSAVSHRIRADERISGSRASGSHRAHNFPLWTRSHARNALRHRKLN